MHPELFEIPLIHLTVRSFGLMVVIGFLFGFFLLGKLGRKISSNPQLITNLALYCLIAGVVGARVFYVVHHFDQMQRPLVSMFAVWQGGLEFYGGVIFAIPVIALYSRYHKIPIRRCLDIVAIALMLGLSFGRMGCFLNGCCFGKPTELPWAVRFPYDSFAYFSQININPERNRPEPRLKLPHDEYSNYVDTNGRSYPKAFEELTEEQKFEVTKGKYQCLSIHPTQLYSSANAALLCFLLYLFWRISQRAAGSGNTRMLFTRPGQTFALTFILYGITRFLIEYLRDDNPFEYAWWAVYKGGTVSQNLSIYLVILGMVLMAVFEIMKSKATKPDIVTRDENKKIKTANKNSR
ncbi:MAG TPA: prolipoprotein diacylglyceryl transferase [Sedimentisphaerales bacterium]|nr:prolipoprotein diacylglyceryl transferase [Sedimentisphaerales bacterium]